MKEYKYYLFENEYGKIYTNYQNFYNRKKKKEIDELLGSLFFRLTFLFLVFTLLLITFYGIYEEDSFLLLSIIYISVSILFTITFIIFLVKALKNNYILDYKLTKEYFDQVKYYKLKQKEQTSEEIIVKLDKSDIEIIVNKLKKDTKKNVSKEGQNERNKKRSV